MADQIRPTPRSPILGLFSDLVNLPLQYMSAPQRTQQMQGVAEFIRSTGVPYALESLSYDPSGRGLFTGAGGLGGTTRLRPEAAEAALTVAPMVGPAARVAGRGAMAVGRAGERYAERVVPQIMERGGLPAEMVSAMGQGTQSPLTVYHGSPYRFDRFDPTKIGSGEGAQAYGYGHYVAQAQDVAKGYKETLAAKGFAKLEELGRNNYRVTAPDGTVIVEGVPLGSATKAKSAFDNQVGSVYTIDLPDEQIAQMLDWDKPLSQQPKSVREALTRIARGDERLMKQFQELGPSAPANQAYAALIQNAVRAKKYEGMRAGLPENEAMPSITFGQDAASELLRQQGIPGIRYLDEGSRGTGQGTSNFVVFPGNEDLLRILEVNGEELLNPIMYRDPFGSTVR